MFDTPKGPMSIIWDRMEGDILPRPNGNSSPEPWISSWNIQTELTLPCKEESITVLNAIGQKESIPVKDHKATITLTELRLLFTAWMPLRYSFTEMPRPA